MSVTTAPLARHGSAYRSALRALPSLPDQPDYALLATGRMMPAVVEPPAPSRSEGARTAGGYLPRWRSRGRRRPMRT